MDRQETMALIGEVREKARQNEKLLTWIIVFAVALALILIAFSLKYLVFTYPVNQVSQYGITNTTEKANLINQYRTTSIQFIATLAQIIGGFVLLLGLYFTWENLITAREGQITERFTRAVDQLGSKELEIRLGGIYALERIANKSDKDYWPIMEILTAYVRINSPLDSYVDTEAYKRIHNKKMDLQDLLAIHDKNMVKQDIQAIIKIIRTRKYSFPTNGEHFPTSGEHNTLDLQRTYLREVTLREAHLEWANFMGAFLERAFLNEADLTNSFFVGATLRYALLEKANLEEANFIDANFEEANLKGANLKGANLKGAINLTVEQLSKAKTLYNAELDEELRRSLEEKRPDLFENPDK